MFRDITTLLQDKEAFKYALDKFYERYKDKEIDVVVGIESRGFIFGSVLAYLLNVSFVPVRKEGKLPHKTMKQEYSLEYGNAVIEIHEDAIKKGQKVLIADDLIATGGTLKAILELIHNNTGAKVTDIFAVVGLPFLGFDKKLSGINIKTLVDYHGE